MPMPTVGKGAKALSGPGDDMWSRSGEELLATGAQVAAIGLAAGDLTHRPCTVGMHLGAGQRAERTLNADGRRLTPAPVGTRHDGIVPASAPAL